MEAEAEEPCKIPEVPSVTAEEEAVEVKVAVRTPPDEPDDLQVEMGEITGEEADEAEP